MPQGWLVWILFVMASALLTANVLIAPMWLEALLRDVGVL
jgi:hypothetical protein